MSWRRKLLRRWSRERLGSAERQSTPPKATSLSAFIGDPELLHLALSHRSYTAEAAGRSSNERLEFLGDAVLGLVVTDYLYRNFPELPEGDLARIRSSVVSTDALAPVAARLGLGEAILLGRGEEASGGREKFSILADGLEAIFGALYLASGLDGVRPFVESLLSEKIADTVSTGVLGDAKNRLQEYLARHHKVAPRYLVHSEGPDHATRFFAKVEVEGRLVGRGEGRSRKHAERAAAENALVVLRAELDVPPVMPELPEVETVRRGLEQILSGRELVSVSVHGTRSVRRQPAEDFVAMVNGALVSEIGRHGKFLYLTLEDPKRFLVIHLRMSGRLVCVETGQPMEPHTHVVFDLEGGQQLRFIDPRTFGEMFVTEFVDDTGLPTVLSHLGRDLLKAPMNAKDLATLARARHVALKTFLLDQRKLAGIGSIYADEICFRVKLRPTRLVDSLTRPSFERLATEIASVLGEAVAARGSSLADVSYKDLFGAPGAYQHQHAVYGRAGAPCVVCATAIKKVRVAGRYAHFCPKCQR